MKRIIGLVLLCFLIVGCNFGTKKESVKEEILKGEGELVVYNQSSKDMYYIIYCGKRLENPSKVWASPGEKVSEKFPNEETGYIFFKINDYKVRTNEIITLQKGERKVVAITDNTLVVVSGESIPVTVLEVIKR